MPGLADRARARRRPANVGVSGGPARLSQRRIVLLAVALVVLLAAGAVAVWLTQSGSSSRVAGQKIPGRPPILIALPVGVASGAASVRAKALSAYVASHGSGDGDALIALAGADAELGQDAQASQALEAAGHLGGANAARAAAALTLLRYRALGEGKAVAGLQQLAAQRPQDAFVRLSLGLAVLYAGRTSEARSALAATRSLDPDGYYGTSADDLLHPEQRPGYPEFVMNSKLSYPTDAAALAAAKAHPTDAAVLLAAAMQLQGTSRREALRLAQQAQTVEGTGNALDAQIAVAILGYDKDNPAAAAGQLGPLVAANPDSALARFTFGLLLFWFDRPADAHNQFLQAAAAEQGTKLAQLAQAFAQGTAGSGPPSTVVPKSTTG